MFLIICTICDPKTAVVLQISIFLLFQLKYLKIVSAGFLLILYIITGNVCFFSITGHIIIFF
ncbi:MAG TPA: hypothetical protein DCZ78_07595 [Blautia sp.]|nr:hypothetical protein [Ruminococcus sp.]RGH51553.1 hypothetical protein DW894_01295 [Ruminococcus sp. AM41-10BH]HBB46678.1 hypothetical protein [Blautia sp.]